jgi:hypothetical protein
VEIGFRRMGRFGGGDYDTVSRQGDGKMLIVMMEWEIEVAVMVMMWIIMICKRNLRV